MHPLLICSSPRSYQRVLFLGQFLLRDVCVSRGQDEAQVFRPFDEQLIFGFGESQPLMKLSGVFALVPGANRVVAIINFRYDIYHQPPV